MSLLRKVTRLAVTAATAALLAGCASGPDGHVTPISGAPVTDNDTPYSSCLSGIAAFPGNNLPTLAVGDIRDKTGQLSQNSYTESTMLTQGVSEMLISALYKSRKVNIAERLELAIPLTEKKLADLGVLAGPAPAYQATPVNFVVLGALTELNYNILSDGVRLFVRGIGAGYRRVIINVGLDLRVVNARTFRTVYVTSLQKQIVGYEVEAGIFSFFGTQLVEFDAGVLQNEPLQVGVRSVVEMAVVQILTEGFGLPTPAECDLVRVGPRSGSSEEEEDNA
ncbi:holdfast anchoring protein HfaB [Paralimibaculum aggregatum]|uniref:Holdfast anchoring protein HfaB n=1 Tax=Paralimibaculum aggregatum TaxID=3036245 RepID=A0ABQ6LPN2_9RHOB|nr:CsgG/HfaB family protein [Limibaculum sp. NKW23]GMG82461.1 holdfast anchoring protein HfaB [Limibaculum sp. NKW23]